MLNSGVLVRGVLIRRVLIRGVPLHTVLCRTEALHRPAESMQRVPASASATTAVLDNSLLSDQREEGEGELSLPQDLLERSSSLGSGSVDDSEPEVQSGGENEGDQMEEQGQLSLSLSASLPLLLSCCYCILRAKDVKTNYKYSCNHCTIYNVCYSQPYRVAVHTTTAVGHSFQLFFTVTYPYPSGSAVPPLLVFSPVCL